MLRNELNGPVWRRIVRFLKRLNWIVDLILGGGILALLLYLIYLYVPIASNKRWTVSVPRLHPGVTRDFRFFG